MVSELNCPACAFFITVNRNRFLFRASVRPVLPKMDRRRKAARVVSAKLIELAEGGFLNVRFSNRPVGVKHFQTIHRFSVNVARGLVLLSGIGTKALVWG
jgi:hypothetical protein